LAIDSLGIITDISPLTRNSREWSVKDSAGIELVYLTYILKIRNETCAELSLYSCILDGDKTVHASFLLIYTRKPFPQ